MSIRRDAERLGLPKHWKRSVQTAVLHTISVARLSVASARGWAANSPNQRVRLQAELDRTREELARAYEQIRIKDARMAQLPPQRRPHYPPTERMAILEHRAGLWLVTQTNRQYVSSYARNDQFLDAKARRRWPRRPGTNPCACEPISRFRAGMLCRE